MKAVQISHTSPTKNTNKIKFEKEGNSFLCCRQRDQKRFNKNDSEIGWSRCAAYKSRMVRISVEVSLCLKNRKVNEKRARIFVLKVCQCKSKEDLNCIFGCDEFT